MFYLCLVSIAAWWVLLVVPFRPWSTKEFFSPKFKSENLNLENLSVLIPARNEEEHIEKTLICLQSQGHGHKIILVDDESTDKTSSKALGLGLKNLQLVKGAAPPQGWSGKVWALHQGLKEVSTPLVLLIDADISLEPAVLVNLVEKMEKEGFDFISIMALLRTDTFWEKLSIPAFIYFFKILYPFSLSNNPNSRIAAAAGGLILTRRDCLSEIGGFSRIKGKIIDDCALARVMKDNKKNTWIGLSRSVRTTRSYKSIGNIWNMVARTAYTQLNYSLALLLLSTLSLVIAFIIPLLGLFSNVTTCIVSFTTLAFMAFTYRPIIALYNLPTLWTLSLPMSASLFIMMTWTSAIRYWKGERSQWKNRIYNKQISDRGRE